MYAHVCINMYVYVYKSVRYHTHLYIYIQQRDMHDVLRSVFLRCTFP